MRGNRDIFPGKVYTIERLLVDKNIGSVAACNINKGQTTIWEEIEIYSQEKYIQ